MKKQVSQVILEAITGNIAGQDDMDAVVNAANRWLKPGGGVAGALHRAAGPELEVEGAGLAPIAPGQAVITGAYGLPNGHVIHVLGPVYGRDRPEDQLLDHCYRRALALAEEHNLQSVAFPAVSTGSFRYPLPEAARIALEAVIDECPRLHSLRHIRFVNYSPEAQEVYEDLMEEMLP